MNIYLHKRHVSKTLERRKCFSKQNSILLIPRLSTQKMVKVKKYEEKTFFSNF